MKEGKLGFVHKHGDFVLFSADRNHYLRLDNISSFVDWCNKDGGVTIRIHMKNGDTHDYDIPDLEVDTFAWDQYINFFNNMNGE